MGQMTLILVLLILSGLLIAKCLSRAGWNKAAVVATEGGKLCAIIMPIVKREVK